MLAAAGCGVKDIQADGSYDPAKHPNESLVILKLDLRFAYQRQPPMQLTCYWFQIVDQDGKRVVASQQFIPNQQFVLALPAGRFRLDYVALNHDLIGLGGVTMYADAYRVAVGRWFQTVKGEVLYLGKLDVAGKIGYDPKSTSWSPPPIRTATRVEVYDEYDQAVSTFRAAFPKATHLPVIKRLLR